MSYWAKFRVAALRGDMVALAGLTRFPLQAGFDSDHDYTRSITRSQFSAYMSTELRCQGSGQGSNLNEIRRNAQLQPPYNFHAGGRAVVGSFEFKEVNGQWRFKIINYGSPEEHQAVLRGHCI